jgi:hypothetical protein
LGRYAPELSSDIEYRISEATLQAYRSPHNPAIQWASDAHAKLLSEGSRLQSSPIGNPDFLFAHGRKLPSKKSRKSELVDHFNSTLMEGRKYLDEDHHERFGIEQLDPGYTIFDGLSMES